MPPTLWLAQAITIRLLPVNRPASHHYQDQPQRKGQADQKTGARP